MAGGQRVAVPFTFKGVSGVEVAKIGSVASDELLPITGTLSAEKLRPTTRWPNDALSVAFLSLENQPTTVPGTSITALTFVIASYPGIDKVRRYVDGDLVYFRTLDASGEIPGGLTNYETYYVNVSETSTHLYMSFHTTRTDALARNLDIGLTNGTLSSGEKSFIVKVSDLLTVRNGLFDNNTDYPVFGSWPGTVPYNADTVYPSWNEVLVQWNHYGGTLLENNGWRVWSGQSFLQNDFPYKDSGIGTPVQARAISMFGAGTTSPAGLSTNYSSTHLEIGHTSAAIESSVGTSTALPGNASVYSHQDWSQVYELPNIKSGGKIRFGAKIRVPDNEPLREKNLGFVWLSLVYPHNASGHRTNKIEYILVKNKNYNPNLPTGELTTLKGTYNFPTPGGTWYNIGDVGNAAEEVGSGLISANNNDKRVLSQAKQVNAEDLGTWTEVVAEIDVPTDIDYSEINRVVAPFAGTTGIITSTNFRMQLGLRFAENGEYIADPTDVVLDSLAEGATGHGILVQSDELEVGGTYYIIRNKSGAGRGSTNLTQAELRAISGEIPGSIESSDTMKVGGTYEVVTAGDGTGDENWGAINVEIGGSFSESLSENLDTFSSDGPVGYCFKVKTLPTLNGKGTVRRRGHPEDSLITVKSTTSIANKGYFKRTSGVVQFYSPYVEYIPPTT